jgi:hypothetical protein
VVAILVGGLKCQTQFWKGTTQGSLQQSLVEISFVVSEDFFFLSPFPKLCPAVTFSQQDGRHSAVAFLLKSALIQVSDYRLLRASGLFSHCELFENNLANLT